MEGYDGTATHMGILPIGLRPLSPSRAGDEAEDLGRILCEYPIQPQVCPAAAERTAARSGAASPGAPGATTAYLWPGVGVGAESHLEGSGLPLVGAAEGPDP